MHGKGALVPTALILMIGFLGGTMVIIPLFALGFGLAGFAWWMWYHVMWKPGRIYNKEMRRIGSPERWGKWKLN